MWKKLTNKQESILVCEASLSKWKYSPWLTLLIMLGLLWGTQYLMGTLLLFPTFLTVFPKIMQGISANDPLDSFRIASDLVEEMPSWYFQLQLFLTAFEILMPILVCRLAERRSLLSMGFTREKGLRRFAAGYGIGVLLIVCSVGICLAFGIVRISANSSLGTVILPVLIYFLGYLIQGTAEETLVRGFFFISLSVGIRRKDAPLWACLISAFLFALMHVANPGMTLLSFLNIFLAGLMLALFMYRFDNIWIAAGLHAAWNFTQGQIFGYGVSGLAAKESIFTVTLSDNALLHGGSFGLEGGLAVTAVQLIAIALLFLIPYQKDFDAAGYIRTRREEQKAA